MYIARPHHAAIACCKLTIVLNAFIITHALAELLTTVETMKSVENVKKIKTRIVSFHCVCRTCYS